MVVLRRLVRFFYLFIYFYFIYLFIYFYLFFVLCGYSLREYFFVFCIDAFSYCCDCWHCDLSIGKKKLVSLLYVG